MASGADHITIPNVGILHVGCTIESKKSLKRYTIDGITAESNGLNAGGYLHFTGATRREHGCIRNVAVNFPRAWRLIANG